MPASGPRIAEVQIGGDAAAWRKCGFDVEDGAAVVGSVRLAFVPGDGGIRGWALSGAGAAEIDGLPTAAGDPPEPAGPHRNGAVRIDHLVVFTPDLRRTGDALEAAGIRLRRIREPGEPGPPVRQAFYRLGEVILEVVESPQMEPGPARFWGATLAVADIDACASLLGERLGRVHAAVQPGRRIATIRRDAGLGAPVALISERP